MTLHTFVRRINMCTPVLVSNKWRVVLGRKFCSKIYMPLEVWGRLISSNSTQYPGGEFSARAKAFFCGGIIINYLNRLFAYSFEKQLLELKME